MHESPYDNGFTLTQSRLLWEFAHRDGSPPPNWRENFTSTLAT